MKVFINHYYNRLRQLDPINEALLKALYVTFPSCLALGVWIYTRRPFDVLFVLLPTFMALLGFDYTSIYKRILVLFYIALLMGISGFCFCVLIQHKMYLLFCLCIITFFSFSFFYAIACRGLSLMVILFVSAGGWYAGTYVFIEAMVGFLITAIWVIIFDYLFYRYRMRASLIAGMEIILQFYKTIIAEENDKIKISRYCEADYLTFEGSKCIAKDHHAFVGKVLKEDKNKLEYKLFSVCLHINKLFTGKKSFSSKNNNYALFAEKFYLEFIGLFRSITMFHEYSLVRTQFRNLSSLTEEVINNITVRLDNIVIAMRQNSLLKNTVEELTIYDTWKLDIEKKLNEKSFNDKDKKNLFKMLYGLSCFLNQLERLEVFLMKTTIRGNSS